MVEALVYHSESENSCSPFSRITNRPSCKTSSFRGGGHGAEGLGHPRLASHAPLEGGDGDLKCKMDWPPQEKSLGPRRVVISWAGQPGRH